MPEENEENETNGVVYCNGIHNAKSGSTEATHPLNVLKQKAVSWNVSLTDEEFVKRMDAEDPMSRFREMFCYPIKRHLPDVDFECIDDPDEDSVYLCGNSLGLMPKSTPAYVQRELDKWAKLAVEGHVTGELPWQWCDELVDEQSSVLVGASRSEVAIMNGLTVNEHLLMISFYQPTKERHKILIESKAFPADQYCVESQIRQRGFNPDTSMVFVSPREGEHTLRTEDILQTIEQEGDSIAVVLLPGVQYFTGQVMDMAAITKAGHAKGCYVGFDLAHAIGNIVLHLHDWDVDFACWCSYKYLCSGAGGIGGIFIHEKHANTDFPKFLGWWGHRHATRFEMTNKMDLYPGPYGYRISNPPGLLVACLQAFLQVFDQTSMAEFREKSLLLTAYMEYRLMKSYGRKPVSSSLAESNSIHPYLELLTPTDPEQRGCQLSVRFSMPVEQVLKELKKRGVVMDKREPDVIRFSANPLYNSFDDIHRFMKHLEEALAAAAVPKH